MKITGDTHGNQILWDSYINSFLKQGDTITVLGDFGVGFFDGKYWTEELFFDYLEEQPYTVLFCDGNHENFEKLKGYELCDWNGGKVQFLRKNVIHLMRGEVYEIEGKKIFVFGGGYSYDKKLRTPGFSWWEEEMPSKAEYENATKNLEACGNKVDYILTHTAPINTIEYMRKMNMTHKNSAIEEAPLNGFLQMIQEETEYKKWYFGHFHIDRELWKDQIAVFDAIRDLETGKILRMRRPSV